MDRFSWVIAAFMALLGLGSCTPGPFVNRVHAEEGKVYVQCSYGPWESEDLMLVAAFPPVTTSASLGMQSGVSVTRLFGQSQAGLQTVDFRGTPYQSVFVASTSTIQLQPGERLYLIAGSPYDNPALTNVMEYADVSDAVAQSMLWTGVQFDARMASRGGLSTGQTLGLLAKGMLVMLAPLVLIALIVVIAVMYFRQGSGDMPEIESVGSGQGTTTSYIHDFADSRKMYQKRKSTWF